MESISVPVIGLFIQALFLIGSVIITLWKFSDTINKRFEHAQKNYSAAITTQNEMNAKSINRVYERMDEKSKAFNETFVRIDVHNLTVQHQEQKTDEKFKTVIQVFELKMEALTKSVNMLIGRQ